VVEALPGSVVALPPPVGAVCPVVEGTGMVATVPWGRVPDDGTVGLAEWLLLPHPLATTTMAVRGTATMRLVRGTLRR
jgi:hypothetical protein